MNKGDMFAVIAGTYCGDILCYIEDTISSHVFLQLPDVAVRVISKTDWQNGVDIGVIDSMPAIPKKYKKFLELQYNSLRSSNESSINC